MFKASFFTINLANVVTSFTLIFPSWATSAASFTTPVGVLNTALAVSVTSFTLTRPSLLTSPYTTTVCSSPDLLNVVPVFTVVPFDRVTPNSLFKSWTATLSFALDRT